MGDLLLEQCGFTVRDVLATPPGFGPDPAGVAAYLVDRHRLHPASTIAVVSYCMAAPLAHELAAALSERAAPVPLLLFNGRAATPEAVIKQCRLSAEQLAGGAARSTSDCPIDAGSVITDPAACLGTITRHLTDIAVAALRRTEDAEDAEDIAADVVAHHVSWLSHLVSACHTSWPKWNGRVLHVMSREHDFTGPWAGAGATRELRVSCERTELLHSPAAREAAISFLNIAQGGAHV